MGKIVKLCTSCDEGFAEKFAFCPNCGGTLQAFEMNPVVTEPQEAAEVVTAPIVADEVPAVTAPIDEPLLEIDEPDTGYETVLSPAVEFDAVEAEAAEVEEPVEIEEEPVAAAPAYFPQTRPLDADGVDSRAGGAGYVPDGDYHITVIEENKNSGTRNGLLLGTLTIMIFAVMTATVYSLFAKELDVASINDDIFNAVIVDDVPTALQEEIQKKNKDDGGGGGGGGRDEKEEVTQGDLADQSRNPTRPPDAKVFRSDNFELQTPPPQTEGDQKFEKKFDRWGDPNGRFASFSNGTGTGGGQGSGTGTGQGSGRGTGAGSGTGSGYGGGLGTGNGNGTGSGDDGDGGPPPAVKGVTQALRILGKPRPGYTDAARQNNIQGTVILRVTFLGSGGIGSISVVKGLPNGLSEQAIAAARRISFEPQKLNGVGQTVTKQVEYSFSIY